MSILTASAYRATQTEAEFQSTITGLVDARRGLWMHIRDSRGQPADGFPDLVIACPPVLAILELKSAMGRPSVKQLAWLDALSRCTHLESGLYRPADFDAIEEMLQG